MAELNIPLLRASSRFSAENLKRDVTKEAVWCWVKCNSAMRGAEASSLWVVIDALITDAAGLEEEDQKSGGTLLSKLELTAPDDNHVVITMPGSDTTRPAGTLDRQSLDNGDANRVAEPHDSAYSAVTTQRGHLPDADAWPRPGQHQGPQQQQLQQHSEHDHYQQQQQQQQQQSQQEQLPQQQQQQQQDFAKSGVQAQAPRHQPSHTVSQVSGRGGAQPEGRASTGPDAGHQQPVLRQQSEPAGATLPNMVAEPLQEIARQRSAGRHISAGQRHQQQQEYQQLQLARRSRSYVGFPRRHLQKRPSYYLPDTALPLSLLHPAAASDAALLAQSEAQSQVQSLQHPSLAGLGRKLSLQSQFGGSSKLGDMLTQQQQLDALRQQLQSLLDASTSINSSLRQVHEQLQAFQTK